MSTLDASWDELATHLCVDPEAAHSILSTLRCHYAQPHRAYHNLDHIADCLNLLRASGAQQTHEILLAIWYHDAIYQPLSPTNEEDSAALLQGHAPSLGISPEVVENASRLILITKHHDRATRPDEQLLADIDRAVLAREPQAYDDYAAAIRREYGAVDDERYRAGRCEFLASQLAQPRLFFTRWANQENFESRARVNLQRELAQLQAG